MNNIFFNCSMECKIKYHHKTGQLQHQDHLTLIQDLQYHPITQQLTNLYRMPEQHPYLICPIQIINQNGTQGIIIKKWGSPLSNLSEAHIQSYIKLSWLIPILNIFVGLSGSLSKISTETILIDTNEEPKVVVVSQCENEEDYLKEFRQVIKMAFRHIKAIQIKCEDVKQIKDIQTWLWELQPPRAGLSIAKLIQLKNVMPKIQKSYRIELSEEEKEWIFKNIGHQANTRMDLVYDGQKNQFDPTQLLVVANKQQLLFLIETTKGKKIVFWMSSKSEVNPVSLFGTYNADKAKKSVLLGLDKRSVHRLQDDESAVGLGRQVLLAIGKVDLIFSAFNCSNISYFPCSYAIDQLRGVKTAEDLLGKQFVLKQFQVYKIN